MNIKNSHLQGVSYQKKLLHLCSRALRILLYQAGLYFVIEYRKKKTVSKLFNYIL